MAMAQQKREKKADPDDIERALRCLQQRSGEVAREFPRRIEGRRKQGDPRIDLRQQPDAEECEAAVAASAA